MKKKILIRCGGGFLIGNIMMYLVPPLLNGSPLGRGIYSEALLARAGSPAAAAAVTLLVMGLFGALCFGGTLFYEIESWPLASATAAHYLAISLGYLLPNWLLGWHMPLKLLAIIEGIMTLGFILIWLFIYLHYKAQVRELNELAKRRNGSKKKTDVYRKEKNA